MRCAATSSALYLERGGSSDGIGPSWCRFARAAAPRLGAVDESRRPPRLGCSPGAWLQLEPVEYPEENALTVYTDGSMLPRPRRGGAAILFVLIDDQGNEEQREE